MQSAGPMAERARVPEQRSGWGKTHGALLVSERRVARRRKGALREASVRTRDSARDDNDERNGRCRACSRYSRSMRDGDGPRGGAGARLFPLGSADDDKRQSGTLMFWLPAWERRLRALRLPIWAGRFPWREPRVMARRPKRVKPSSTGETSKREADTTTASRRERRAALFDLSRRAGVPSVRRDRSHARRVTSRSNRRNPDHSSGRRDRAPLCNPRLEFDEACRIE